MSPCGASAACVARHFVLGTSQEVLPVASTTKYLAQKNKSAGEREIARATERDPVRFNHRPRDGSVVSFPIA
jgi:hypothetical protein